MPFAADFMFICTPFALCPFQPCRALAWTALSGGACWAITTMEAITTMSIGIRTSSTPGTPPRVAGSRPPCTGSEQRSFATSPKLGCVTASEGVVGHLGCDLGDRVVCIQVHIEASVGTCVIISICVFICILYIYIYMCTYFLLFNIHICVLTYIYIYIHMSACISIYVYVYICMYISIYLLCMCVYTLTSFNIDLCVRAWMAGWMYAWMDGCMSAAR